MTRQRLLLSERYRIDWEFMARKPNYRFERHERERAKAAKKAAKQEAKAEKKGEPQTDDSAGGDQSLVQNGEVQ
jgi:hypothetical protein